MSSRATQIKRMKRRAFLFHTALVLFTVLFFATAIAFAGLFTIFNGPSRTTSDKLVRSLMQTDTFGFVPYLFMPKESVEASLARTSPDGTEAADNGAYAFAKDLTPGDVLDDPKAEYGADSAMQVLERPGGQDGQEDLSDPYGVGEGVRIERVVRDTFSGYVAVVDDPSRVSVAAAPDGEGGLTEKPVSRFAEENGAILAVNAGAYDDAGADKNGPVVSGGALYGTDKASLASAGFDGAGSLIVGSMTAKEAGELGLRDCVSCGPALIVNGRENEKALSDASLAPRTAIGQRADGAVVLLVADGHQPDSIGAGMEDLIDLMREYSAVNACVVGGGSSAVMYANGQQLNTGAAGGALSTPTAIIVR